MSLNTHNIKNAFDITNIDIISTKGILDSRGGKVYLQDETTKYFIKSETDEKVVLRLQGNYNYFRNTDPSKGSDDKITGIFNCEVTIDKTSEKYKNKSKELLADYIKLECYNNNADVLFGIEGIPNKDDIGDVIIYLK